MFSLSTHPAFLTVTQGIQDAFRYLGTTWRRWLPMVVAVAVCTLALYAVLYAILGSSDFTNLYYVDRYSSRIQWAPDAQAKLLSLVFPMLALGSVYLVVSAVAGWVFCATAIDGLRNRPFSASNLINRGLRAIAAGIVIGLVGSGAFFALIVFTIVTLGIGILLWFVAIPAAVYVAIRISFYNLAIFDGFGPIDGIKESWRLSKGSVLRIFGWGLMAGLIGIVFSFASSFVSIPFTLAGAQAVGQALSTAIAMTASCFSIYMMAVLYESERARKNPAAYGLVQTPNPYAPNPYAAGPYAQGPSPYAQWPTPYAQAPNPYAPNPYAQAPNPYAQWPTPYAQAPNPYAPAPYSPPPTWQGTPPPQPWPAPQPPTTLPYQGAAPGYPGSQPPEWQAPSAPPAWASQPNVAPAPDQPANTPPPGPAPTDPPTAG